MMDYNLDMGSSSDSDEEGGIHPMAVLDSDEEEKIENAKILKMLSMKMNSVETSKSQKKIVDFETEMEAELDRRAFVVENEGGMEHQRSLSRSSSNSSLHSLSRTTITYPKPCSSGSSLKQIAGPAGEDAKSSGTAATKKSVKFSDSEPGTSSSSTQINDPEKSNAEEFYDKIYFDSDESEGEDDLTKNKKTKKRKFMSNDDLFYDPNSDAEDQAWIDRQRRKQFCKQIRKNIVNPNDTSTENKAENSESQTEESGPSTGQPNTGDSAIPLPSSDAVLNCPACFSVLCLDCQRHEFYVGQYRAMFVLNCKIDRSETLKVPLKGGRNKSKKNKNGNRSQSEMLENLSTDPADTFFPVQCKICNTQVAMYDKEEIFHFFNCLASHP